eukprot:6193364-Pyramimonas_sp.AAC.1
MEQQRLHHIDALHHIGCTTLVSPHWLHHIACATEVAPNRLHHVGQAGVCARGGEGGRAGHERKVPPPGARTGSSPGTKNRKSLPQGQEPEVRAGQPTASPEVAVDALVDVSRMAPVAAPPPTGGS